MIADNLKLDGKVAIITGAGRGLGRAMAVKFAEAGADIVAAARTGRQLDETAGCVSKLGRKCLIVPTDVTAPRRSTRWSRRRSRSSARSTC